MNINPYLKQLNRHYQTGRATEHTHRSALEALLNTTFPDIQVINEPKQIDCGAPDYVLSRNNIPLGYIEAKDIGKNLDDPSYHEQLKRYTESLDNLIFTNYTEFRLLREGKTVSTVTIGEIADGKIKGNSKNLTDFSALLDTFISYQGQPIQTANDLAKHMARKARLLAETITKALNQDQSQDQSQDQGTTSQLGNQPSQMDSALQGQLSAFQKHLIHDIAAYAFADIYAQTVAYGMFAARLHDPTPTTFTRREAAELIPANNPFLRKFFQHIAGYELDQRIRWIVDDLADVFRAADVSELMKDYGRATQRNDPFLHFYETFLGEYDPRLRKSRGVYYTPKPVVDFIVRAVDDILKNQFDFAKGIADTSTTTIEIDAQATAEQPDPHKKPTTKHSQEVHKVQILDPATGTGTFLAAIVQHIFETQFANHKGIWSDYVKTNLIPRLNGFEVLMASYAMAHTKLDMVLRDSGCQLADNQRLRIFLTNSLEEHHPDTDSLFARWLSAEANEANFIKRNTPVMVVIGNPPYSGESANKGEWIAKLLQPYKQEPGGGKLQEKNSKWLNDDYVKFIRYGQHAIDRTGEGILAYINNHSFLDNPTFRGMRWSLLQSFDAIYIIDLHGNSKKKETAPDGSADKNVFDIQQGVSINLFIKSPKKKDNTPARVFHHDLYGQRESKYQFLWQNNLAQIDFQELKPQAPQYFFVPIDYSLQAEYDKGFSVSALFKINGAGITTAHDDFVIDQDKDVLLQRFEKLRDTPRDLELLHREFNVRKKKGWDIFKGYDNIQHEPNLNKYIKPISYRPFDSRFIFYEGSLVWRTVEKIMQHFLKGENVGLITIRRSRSSENWREISVTKNIIAGSTSISALDINYVFPLYLYPDTNQQTLDNKQTREPNLDKDIVQTIATGLDLRFTPEVETTIGLDLRFVPEDETAKATELTKATETANTVEATDTFAPIDLLDYIYAVLHSPTYRERYQEFLKIDFPRVPYPTDQKQFRKLAQLGSQLRTLHLLESPTLNTRIIGYPEAGDHKVTKPHYTLTDHKNRLGNVNINPTQYFSNVPETAWNFHIGGYQPAQKWLKDRTARTLTYPDITHYQKIIIALTETKRLMGEIEQCGIGCEPS